jgi:hypothetical protein
MSTPLPHAEFAEELALTEILDLADRGVPIEEAIAKYQDISLETLSTLTLAAHLTRERDRIAPPREILQEALAAMGAPTPSGGARSWLRLSWKPIALALPAMAVLALALLGRPETVPLTPTEFPAASTPAPAASLKETAPLSAERLDSFAASAALSGIDDPLAGYYAASVEETAWVFPSLDEESSHAETVMSEEAVRAEEFPTLIHETTL